MITIIVGTNRKKSKAGDFGKKYYDSLIKLKDNVNLLYLKDVDTSVYNPDMYDEDLNQNLLKIQDEWLIPANKFIFVIPEYNGGMPGALKMFIDAISIRKRSETFEGKKAAIVGVAGGRAGNLRGMEHLTGVLNYLGTIVLPNRQPYSSIYKLMDKQGNITDESTLRTIENHVTQIINF
jgi:NAD(P)H-dependent FMN reductase